VGCIDNKQKIIMKNIENNNSTNEVQMTLVDDYYKELEKAGEIAHYIDNMNLINNYNRPKINFVFDEDYFYMNESEKDKVEYENALIELDNCTIHLIDLNKIEGLEKSDNAYDYINSIAYTAFTPVYNLGNEQIIRITNSRNILLKHCSTEFEKNMLSKYFKIIDVWSKFKDSLAYANVPMNNSDTNRTFVIDNVEDMDIITGLKWKQTDLRQYFEFLDSSGFNSSDDLLTFARQFRIAQRSINSESSDGEREKVYNARKFVIANFPQYSDNGIHRSDIKMYFTQCDNKVTHCDQSISFLNGFNTKEN
jgi:hypothetical protein